METLISIIILFGSLGVFITTIILLANYLNYRNNWIRDYRCIGTFTFKRFYALYLANPKGWYLHDHGVKYHKGMGTGYYDTEYYIAFSNWFEYRKYKHWREADENKKKSEKNNQKMLEVINCIKEDIKEEEEKYQAKMKLDLIRNFMYCDDLKNLFNAIVDNKKNSYLKVSSEDKDVVLYLSYIKKFLNITWTTTLPTTFPYPSGIHDCFVKWDGTYTDPSTWVKPEGKEEKEENHELPL